jgi:hypothetical protein
MSKRSRRRGTGRCAAAPLLFASARFDWPIDNGTRAVQKFSRHHFVDRMFTTSSHGLFTKACDVIAQTATISCVYRTCNAD